MQFYDSGSEAPVIDNSFQRQLFYNDNVAQDELDHPQKLNGDDSLEEHIPLQSQIDAGGNGGPEENFPSQEILSADNTSKVNDSHGIKKHASLFRREVDYNDYDGHSPVRREEDEEEKAETTTKKKKNESDNDDSDEGDEPTEQPDVPMKTWTEVMGMFRHEFTKPKIYLNVGGRNIFRFIAMAIEHAKALEIDLLRLHTLLKRLRHKIGDDNGKSNVNININAASPLGISADSSNQKRFVAGEEFMEPFQHNSNARSPIISQVGDSEASMREDENLAQEKRKFIKKGAEFLRNAWYEYKTGNHQMFERSDDRPHRKTKSIRNRKIDKMLESEKKEYIKKGVAFLHNAWNKYKLRKYHHHL